VSIVAFICYLAVAAVCAFIAQRFAPGSVPGGFLTALVVGLIGAWSGGSMVDEHGPIVAGISVVPCIIGSAVVVFGVSLCGGLRRHA